jgi:hypothetical protein
MGTLPLFPARLHLRQQFHQDVAEKLCRKDAQPFRYGLLRHNRGLRPQNTAPVQLSDRFHHRTHLAPDQAQDKCHHHRQRQDPLAQSHCLIRGDLRVHDRRHQLLQQGFNFSRRRFSQRLFASIFLDRSRMPHAAAFSFFPRFFAHGISLPHVPNFSYLDSLLRCLTCY